MTEIQATIHHGDCRNIIATLPDCSVDSIVTDPPYELGFMGKQWDGSGIAYDQDLWRECLRVLKPGGHLLAFGGTRTYHRMAVAIEDAGFEIRDSIHWLYGSGFPKSLDVSKAIDKAAGEEGLFGAPKSAAHAGWINRGRMRGANGHEGHQRPWMDDPESVDRNARQYLPATDAARQWEGWGTALKPAHEPIVVARKPLSGTLAATVLEHGTGAINIDGCRIVSTPGDEPLKWSTPRGGIWTTDATATATATATAAGRWPANLILTHSANCGDNCAPDCPIAELDRQSGIGSSAPRSATQRYTRGTLGFRMRGVDATDRGHTDTGGASRFFTVTEWDPIADVAPFRYVAKPSKRERNAGLDGLPERHKSQLGSDRASQEGLDPVSARFVSAEPVANVHPTVKPLALMRWLVRLVTPPGGTVLEPFAGSGTTMAAAILEDRHVIGCELTAEYLPIIEGRIAWAHQQRNETPATLFDPTE